MDFLPDLTVLAIFSGASFLLAATPGPDMTLSISRALRDGRLAGLAVLLGTNIGIACHTLLVAFGISALITASPLAFLLLKSGGAAYLAYLAIQAVRKGSRFVAKAEAGQKSTAKSAFLNGIWVNLLNPKVIIFFMTFLPQFVSADDAHVTARLIFLGFWFMVVSLPVTIAIVLAADKLSGWLNRNPKVLRGIDLTFAGVFSVFAVKILLTQSR